MFEQPDKTGDAIMATIICLVVIEAIAQMVIAVGRL